MAVLLVLRSKESPLDPSIRLEQSCSWTVEPFGNTGCALINDLRRPLQPCSDLRRNVTLPSAWSQSHNLKVGLHGVCSATKLCDKSRGTPDDASTKLGELATNLSRAPSRFDESNQRSVNRSLAGCDTVQSSRTATERPGRSPLTDRRLCRIVLAADGFAGNDVARCAAEGVLIRQKRAARPTSCPSSSWRIRRCQI